MLEYLKVHPALETLSAPLFITNPNHPPFQPLDRHNMIETTRAVLSLLNLLKMNIMVIPFVKVVLLHLHAAGVADSIIQLLGDGEVIVTSCIL